MHIGDEAKWTELFPFEIDKGLQVSDAVWNQ